MRIAKTSEPSPAATVETANAKLHPDEAKLDRDEAQRFFLLEGHWEVTVPPSAD